MKTEGRKLELRMKVLWPFILVSTLWTIFSIWICIRENEFLWSVFLIALGLIPLFWEIYISPNINEEKTEIKIIPKQRKIFINLGISWIVVGIVIILIASTYIGNGALYISFLPFIIGIRYIVKGKNIK